MSKLVRASPKLFELSAIAYDEFNDLSDFVWKLPQFIELQSKIETEKLDVYFPEEAAKRDPFVNKLRVARKHYEFKKIEGLFPYTIAVSNLYSAASLFENYMILLIKEIDRDSESKFEDQKGTGFSKALNYLSDNGFRPKECTLYTQADSIICIRNLLYHASGHLDWFRESKKAELICKNGLYLAKEIVDHRKKKKIKNDEMTIVETPRGRRLQISNHFSHYAVSVFRDYFGYVYQAVQGATVGSSR